ncbi:MAG TPA: class I SAM-dependent methyltransferase [Acidimicrobiales bacterium]|nr:class I SAM-dependent methyltransferase [Acidimicrobiales bacterium]
MSGRPDSHAQTYRGLGPAAIIHRRRLAAIERMLSRLVLDVAGEAADFGCSDGFVISVLQERSVLGQEWWVHGFDHSERLLNAARARSLPRTTFSRTNLNEPPPDDLPRFDLVTCFETLEHVGDYHNALRHLAASCRPGGWLVISVPNEVGIPGLVKYAGRRILRRRAYGDFFSSQSEASYLAALVTGRPIEPFRQPPRSGWGPHLGFDYRCVLDFARRELAGPSGIQLVHRSSAALGCGYLFALRKGPIPSPSGP